MDYRQVRADVSVGAWRAGKDRRVGGEMGAEGFCGSLNSVVRGNYAATACFHAQITDCSSPRQSPAGRCQPLVSEDAGHIGTAWMEEVASANSGRVRFRDSRRATQEAGHELHRTLRECPLRWFSGRSISAAGNLRRDQAGTLIYRLETKDRPAANVVVVLACMRCVDIDRRLAGPYITRFKTKPKKTYTRNFRVKTDACFQRTAIVHPVTCIRSKENKILAGRIMRKATPKTDPGRDAEIRN